MKRVLASRRRVPRIAVAVMISAVMGMVYLLANASALAGPVALAVRIAGVVAFVGIIVAVRTIPETAHDPTGGGFGRGYWTVVALEVVVGLGGALVLTQVLDAPRATLPWITFVVGVHFFGLGVVFRSRLQHVVAVLVTLCGASGLLAVGLGASDAIVTTVAGLLPGAILIGAALWGLRVARRR